MSKRSKHLPDWYIARLLDGRTPGRKETNPRLPRWREPRQPKGAHLVANPVRHEIVQYTRPCEICGTVYTSPYLAPVTCSRPCTREHYARVTGLANSG